MSWSKLWRGGRNQDDPAVVLIPPGRMSTWTDQATGYVWAKDAIRGHLSSSPIFVFEHDAQAASDVLASSATLMQEILGLVSTNTDFRNRSWLLLGHGIGGTIAKCTLVRDEISSIHTGLILLDTPNLAFFETPTDAIAATVKLGWQAPVTDEEIASFNDLYALEKRFVRIASKITPLLNVFSIQNSIERQALRLHVSGEAPFCFQRASYQMGIYADKTDQQLCTLLSILSRAVTLTAVKRSQGANIAASPRLDSKTKKLLERHFPLKSQPIISLHHIQSFTCATKEGSLSVKTTVRSEALNLIDLPSSVQAENPIDSASHSQAVNLKWLHGPDNRSAWVEHAVGCLLDSSSFSTSEFLSSWTQNFLSTKGLRIGSWHVKPICLIGPEQSRRVDKSCGLIIAMPFVHWDTVEHLSEREETVDILSSGKLRQTHLAEYENAGTNALAGSSTGSVFGKNPISLPQPLDQYNYPTIALPANRFQNQILPKCTKSSLTGKKMLTVHQLWLVALSSTELLTFFSPKAVDESCIEISQIGDIENAILDYVTRAHHPSDVCSDVYDLSALVINACATTLLGQSQHPDIQFFSLYRSAVGELRRLHVRALTSFKDENLQSTTIDVSQDSKEENHELSLIVDAQALKDELRAISEIIEKQIGILHQFGAFIPESIDDEVATSTAGSLNQATMRQLRTFNTDFQALYNDAEAIERDLLQLLDLRQKRANLQRAHASMLMAQESSRQTKHSLSLSESAAWQSKVVMIFTLLTSIYLPLSFFSSYYGMNAREITGDPANKVSTRDYWKIAGPASVGVTLIAVFVGFRLSISAALAKWGIPLGRKKRVTTIPVVPP